MKKVTILMTAVLLSSCSITQYYVDNEYTLSTVENNVKNVEVKTFNYTYSDDLIDVTMKFGEKSIDFSMINMSNSSIKILWDDADLIKQTAQDVGISQAEVIHELIEQYKRCCEE